MKRQFTSTILRFGVGLVIGSLLTNSLALRAQESGTVIIATPPSGGANPGFRTASEAGAFGLVIDGFGIGTILLNVCDLDSDGKVALAELKEVAEAYFTLWDANANGSVSGSELSAALKELFPVLPAGVHGVRIINGVAIELPPDELPKPDAQVTKHILAGADSNEDGALTLQEVSVFLLGKCFSQWDRDGSGSLDVQELNEAFGQLAKPD
jgi:Ca2+-binding EF-hand superfamily protein